MRAIASQTGKVDRNHRPGFEGARKLADVARLKVRLLPSAPPVLITILMVVAVGFAQAKSAQLAPDELVRRTVSNELKAANAPGHYMYRMRIQRAGETQTREIVETRNWLIGRLIQIDGRPLTPKREHREEERLMRMLKDESLRQEEAKDQQRLEGQVRDLLKALPDAFIYRYIDLELAGTAPALERLSFEPNPHFRAPSQRLEVLQGMKGTMLIDTRADRLVRLQGDLFRGVNFGWGILAHLDPGGHLVLEQRDVGSGRWAIARLSLHFTGKLLMFKTLRIDTTFGTSDFRRMRDDLTLLEGLELLKNRSEMTRSAFSSRYASRPRADGARTFQYAVSREG